MPAAAYILFGAVFTYLVSLALGKLLLRRLAVPLYPEEELTLGFVVGSACLSLLVFLLAVAGEARKGVFLIAGLAILGLAYRAGAHRVSRKRFPALPRFWKYVFAAVLAAYFFLYFVNAMAPEMSPDGASSHLGLVNRYAKAHRLLPITTDIFANQVQAIEMLFLFAFVFGKHSAAALVHFSFLATMPWMMLSYARRFGFPVAGAAGALFFAVSPVVGQDGTTAYIDVAVATILFALFYLLQIWNSERHPGFFVPIGLLAGFGYSAKYAAVLALPYALGFVAWKARKLRPLVIVSVCALVLMVPWLVKNWIVAQNPFAPFLNRHFPNPYVHVMFEKELGMFSLIHALPGYWQIPREVTVGGGRLGGFLGPLFLLAPLSLFALRWPQGRQLLLAGFLFLLPYPFHGGTRFLIFPLPFFSLAVAMSFAVWRPALLALLLAHAVASWPKLMSLYCAPYAWRLDSIPIKAALRIIPEQSYLEANCPGYRTSQMLDRYVPEDKRVLVMLPIAQAYTSRETLVRYEGALNETMGDFLFTALTPAFQPSRIQTFRFPATTLRKVRIVQTARCDYPEQWSIAELRVYLSAVELPRASEWRLSARPNPWQVQLAFDNSAITRWRTWDTAAPGDSIEIDFGQPRVIDCLRAEGPPDSVKKRTRLEGMDPSGHWIQLVDLPEESNVQPPDSLRRAATFEMKQRGVDYILLDKSDSGAEDVQDDPESWGMTFIAQAGQLRLYRIEPLRAGAGQ